MRHEQGRIGDTGKVGRMNRQSLLSLCSEEEFQEHVIGFAHLQGWRVHAERKARIMKRGEETWVTPIQGDPGFQDLVMVRGDRIIFTELKSSKGKESHDQGIWHEVLTATGKVEVYLWRPAMWNSIVDILT